MLTGLLSIRTSIMVECKIGERYVRRKEIRQELQGVVGKAGAENRNKSSDPVRNEGTVRNSRLQRTAASAVAPKCSGNKICIGVL